MIIIDAKDLICGRLATRVAKSALLGEQIHIVNSDKVVILGTREYTQAYYFQKIKRGTPARGPFFSRKSNMLLRRVIRGMLPYRNENGKKAYANIKCHVGIPKEFEGKELITFKEINVANSRTSKYITMGEVAKHLGGRA